MVNGFPRMRVLKIEIPWWIRLTLLFIKSSTVAQRAYWGGSTINYYVIKRLKGITYFLDSYGVTTFEMLRIAIPTGGPQ